MIDQKKLEQRFTMIRNGSEYPIACYNGNHYYIADRLRCDQPFEKCNGKHLDFGYEPQEPQKVVSQPSTSEGLLLTDEDNFCIRICTILSQPNSQKSPMKIAELIVNDFKVFGWLSPSQLAKCQQQHDAYCKECKSELSDIAGEIKSKHEAELNAIRQEERKQIGEILDNAEMNSTAGTNLPTLERMIAKLKSGKSPL
jgi:hypothetical protein